MAAAQEAYAHGVNTCNVDELAKALGSRASARVGARESAQSWMRTWSGFATVPRKVSIPTSGRHQSAQAPNWRARGERRASITAVATRLVTRELTDIELVISDAHEGLKQTISQLLAGASRQCWTVRFVHNLGARNRPEVQATAGSLQSRGRSCILPIKLLTLGPGARELLSLITQVGKRATGGS